VEFSTADGGIEMIKFLTSLIVGSILLLIIVSAGAGEPGVNVRAAYNSMVKKWHLNGWPGPPPTHRQYAVIVAITAVHGGGTNFVLDISRRALKNLDASHTYAERMCMIAIDIDSGLVPYTLPPELPDSMRPPAMGVQMPPQFNPHYSDCFQ
jgi:hypothetical protein